MESTITIKDDEYESSVYNTTEWKNEYNIWYWEHDFEERIIIFKFKKKTT